MGIFALAPGVSAALITTLVGLIVALPGMVAFNYIVSRVRGMIVRFDNFAAGALGRPQSSVCQSLHCRATAISGRIRKP